MSKLYRSRRDSKLFGLCGGLAELLNVDVTLLRLVVVVTAFFSGGTVLLLYVLASLVIPREPVFDPPYGFGAPPVPPQPPFGGWSSPRRGFAKRSDIDPQHPPYSGPSQPHQPASNLDERMKDIEKKAMAKELEELRAKLANYEKGER